MSRPLVLVAAAALIDADRRVLVAQRPPGKHLAGQWEFPGGKVEPGETPEAALRREIAEELGVTLECVAPAGFATHAYDSFDLVLLLWMCREWRGAPSGPPLRWLPVPRLHALVREGAMPPADAPLVQLLESVM